MIAINDKAEAKTVSLPSETVLTVVTDKDNDLCEKTVSGRNLTLTQGSVTTIIF